VPDNDYRDLHFSNIDRLTRLNKRFKEQSYTRIKLTTSLELGKMSLSNFDTENNLDG